MVPESEEATIYVWLSYVSCLSNDGVNGSYELHIIRCLAILLVTTTLRYISSDTVLLLNHCYQ